MLQTFKSKILYLRINHTIMKDSIKNFINVVEKRNPNEPEFLQAVTEVAETVIPFIEKNPQYGSRINY